eukprot:CAMPEP_0180116598 /NCGR_PEP_ID=MMETSP0986-20121125/461_1 /TAXON_ID=697907 /ORGANISM="non described non described, Strain CCMP2293" /LENGTH=116 /DNA_ID=CAMNT_0022055397 /DNA_START=659 /DNA_END=1006 /DNA_ORIENTATION=+
MILANGFPAGASTKGRGIPTGAGPLPLWSISSALARSAPVPTAPRFPAPKGLLPPAWEAAGCADSPREDAAPIPQSLLGAKDADEAVNPAAAELDTKRAATARREEPRGRTSRPII